MKPCLTLLILFLLCWESLAVLKINLNLERVPHERKFDSDEVITTYNANIGEDLAPLASFSYCAELDMKTGKCCPSLMKDYKLIFSEVLSQDEYTYAILVSNTKKRVVCTFSGTKRKRQLAKEAIYSRHVDWGDSKKKMKIMNYFNKIYELAKLNVKKTLLELKNKYRDYQYIFTGHSLGAAMSTIFALDSVLNGYVERKENSPVLVNFASPRVGNFYFASQVMLNVPVVQRVVRDGDPVPNLPPCRKRGKCKNKLKMDKFPATEADLYAKNKKDKSYWHIGGLILYDNEMKNYQECGKEEGENFIDESCKMNPTLDNKSHSEYFGYQISKYCRPDAQALKKAKNIRLNKLK